MGSKILNTKEFAPTDPILRLLTFHKSLYTLPIDFHYNEYENIYVISRNSKRKYISVLIYLIFLSTHCSRFAKEIYGELWKSDPLRLFQIAKVLGDGTHTTCVAYTLFYKSEQLIDLINFLHLKGSFISPCFPKGDQWGIRIGNIAFYATIITFLLLRFISPIHTNNWEINSLLLESFAEKGMSYFPTELNIKDEKVVWFGIILYVVVRILGAIIWSFGDWGNLVIGLTFYKAVKHFEEVIREDRLHTDEILRYYAELKQLCTKITKVMGLMIFSLCLPLLPYFVTNFVNFLYFDNVVELLKMNITFAILCSSLLVFTCVNLKATEATEIVLSTPKYYREIPPSELQILLHEFHNNRIAVSGLGLFKVTSGFLGSITGLILTFAVIFIQFQQDKRTSTSNNS